MLLNEALAVFGQMQKTYGKDVNIEILGKGFQFAFEDQYTMDQVLYALKIHLKNSTDFPTPAHVTAILNPVKPRPSYADYIAALDWQKRNRDWSAFSYEAGVIRDYRLAFQADVKAHDEQEREIEMIGKAAPSLLLESRHDD